MKYYVIPNLSELDKYLKLASEYNLGFEYNDFFDPNLLDNNEKLNDTISKYQSLKRKGDTLHGVFYDITLDSVDKKIKEVSLERVRSSLDIALKLNCKGVVFHTNYITWMKDKVYQDNWVKVHKELFIKLASEYKGLEIYVENMFDLDPDLLARLMNEINDERIGVCLDIAHASISPVPIEEWFNKLSKYIKHIHINDNDKIVDSHMELGKGIIDYKNAYKLINKLPDDTSILIEIRDYDKVVNSINYLKGSDFKCF